MAIELENLKKCAVKEIDITNMNYKEKLIYIKEKFILERIDHPNIVKILDFY